MPGRAARVLGGLQRSFPSVRVGVHRISHIHALHSLLKHFQNLFTSNALSRGSAEYLCLGRCGTLGVEALVTPAKGGCRRLVLLDTQVCIATLCMSGLFAVPFAMLLCPMPSAADDVGASHGAACTGQARGGIGHVQCVVSTHRSIHRWWILGLAHGENSFCVVVERLKRKCTQRASGCWCGFF